MAFVESLCGNTARSRNTPASTHPRYCIAEQNSRVYAASSRNYGRTSAEIQLVPMNRTRDALIPPIRLQALDCSLIFLNQQLTLLQIRLKTYCQGPVCFIFLIASPVDRPEHMRCSVFVSRSSCCPAQSRIPSSPRRRLRTGSSRISSEISPFSKPLGSLAGQGARCVSGRKTSGRLARCTELFSAFNRFDLWIACRRAFRTIPVYLCRDVVLFGRAHAFALSLRKRMIPPRQFVQKFTANLGALAGVGDIETISA